MGLSESVESLRSDWRKALLLINSFFLLHLLALILIGYYALEYREAFPYLNSDYLEMTIRTYYFLLTAALFHYPLIAKLSLKFKAIITNVVIAFWSLFGFHLSFSLGFDTTPYGTSFLIIWSVSVLFLFGKNHLKTVVVSAFLMLLYFGVLESNQIFPYAPLMSSAPFDGNGILFESWRALMGAGNLFGAVVGIYLFNLTLNRLDQEKIQLVQSQHKLQHTNQKIRQYLPLQLVENIMNSSESYDVPERKRLTVFFSDIVGFTELSDMIEPEDFTRILNEYFDEMTQIAHNYEATIDKYIGDAILIFFGAPKGMEEREQVRRAVLMAQEMKYKMDELNKRWFHQGIERQFTIRMAINTGVVNVGSFGNDKRKDYTIIGTQVNIPARVQQVCPENSLVVTHPTWALLDKSLPVKELGSYAFKGIRNKLIVYEVNLNKQDEQELA